eukprot:g3555.t1
MAFGAICNIMRDRKMRKRREIVRRLRTKYRIDIAKDPATSGEKAAKFVANKIRKTVEQNGQCRVIFATGNSQLHFLKSLVSLSSYIPWDKVTAFHLDEYVGLKAEENHAASFRKYLRERLFSKVRPAKVHYIEPSVSNAKAKLESYSALLQEGPIDLACIGIGENRLE